MLTDPIADMLTRIRNAVAIERPFVEIPASQEKIGLAQVLAGTAVGQPFGHRPAYPTGMGDPNPNRGPEAF